MPFIIEGNTTVASVSEQNDADAVAAPACKKMPFNVEDYTTVVDSEQNDAVAAPVTVVDMEQQLSSMILASSMAKTSDARQSAANEITTQVVKAFGAQKAFSNGMLLAHLERTATDKKDAGARESAMMTIASLATLGASMLPYILPTLSFAIEACGDRTKPVAKAGKVAFDSLIALIKLVPMSIKSALPFFYQTLSSEQTAWQGKVAALKALNEFATLAPTFIDRSLPEIIPVVSANIWDSKPDVSTAAIKTLTSVCNTVTNPDLHPFIPQLVLAIKEPSQASETVYKLASTTFVTTVEAPSLAIMAPILYRGLAESARATLRQTSVIIDNMCKLVEVPAHAEQFLPKLLPGLDRCIETAADPELRTVATRARATLVRVSGGDARIKIETESAKFVKATKEAVAALKTIVTKTAPDAAVDETTYTFVGQLCTALDDVRDYKDATWANLSVFFEAQASPAASAVICSSISAHFDALNAKRKQRTIVADADEGEELCNCEFSLAYGGMILLNNTHFRLTRGQRYGLCGPNGVGKSTLMRAIANGQLDGFPSRDVLKTVFVEHNLQASDAQKEVLEFVTSDPEFAKTDRKVIVDTLASVGFDSQKQAMPVAALSGGWKMKLELARAMLMNADILLLDEPTNHLDKANVAWLTKYLTGLKHVTSIIVSHDSGFLDDVCSHIIHYEHMKLKTYKGNLSAFVKVKPEAKSYYTLSNANVAFKFPEPGFLEGIKSKDRAILKMLNVTFQYPKTPKPTVTGVTLQCSLSSRVAIVGPNGAGKSTVVKILTGETEATSGDVWKHPTLRVAYVAQHAFHHIEQHLDKTPNEYIRWRFQTGEDREQAEKITRQLTPQELKAFEQIVVIDTEKRKMENIMGRRTAKRSFEYEIKWQGKSWDDNTWMSRQKLEDMGLEKFLKIFDEKEAAREGLFKRPLTSVNVEKQLGDTGLPAEFASHSRIRGLSGGQKVKVVIAAAMWNNPHILVLDEPTNYLDRDSLGALAEAIKEFGGGVIMVSHHSEFTDALCSETWVLADGRLTVNGANVPQIIEKIEQKEQLETVDAFGNIVKVKSTRTLTRKERLQKEKKRAAKIANGEPLDSDDEDF